MVSFRDSLISHHLSGMWEGERKRHLWNAYYVLVALHWDCVPGSSQQSFEVRIIIPSLIGGKTETQRF